MLRKTSKLPSARVLLAAATALSLGACAATTGLNGSFCEIAKPIGWADADTDGTIVEVKEHNAVGKKLNCKAVNPAWEPLR